jgi:polysaccharide biosynthesis/export protein
MGRSARLRAAALAALLAQPALAACSAIPGNGPLAGSVITRAQANGRVLFDVVPVDERVIAVLHAVPRPSFAARFKKYGRPPDLKIAIGDMLEVLIWQSGGGLLAPSPSLPVTPPSGPALPMPRIEPRFRPALHSAALASQPLSHVTLASGAATLPDQLVQPDGTMTIPYAGRIMAAGYSAEEVQHELEARLAGKALAPQVLVIDLNSPANSVSASGEMLKGGRIPLAAGGERLLQVIAAAGGTRAPVRDVFVRLSRGAVTATIPLATLVSDPDEDIYAEPGDILTLIEVPQTFAIFGAATRNAAIPFRADRLNLAEALAKSRGLDDNLANPKGVFLFRWEREAVVHALGQPLAAGASGGFSPIVYRFDLGDAHSYLLAREFSVLDKDVILVADADAVPLRKVFEVVGMVVGPYRTALLVCRRSRC